MWKVEELFISVVEPQREIRALIPVSERWQQELGKRGKNVWGLVFGERVVICKMVGCLTTSVDAWRTMHHKNRTYDCKTEDDPSIHFHVMYHLSARSNHFRSTDPQVYDLTSHLSSCVLICNRRPRHTTLQRLFSLPVFKADSKNKRAGTFPGSLLNRHLLLTKCPDLLPQAALLSSLHPLASDISSFSKTHNSFP
jgi:hypothetical protein